MANRKIDILKNQNPKKIDYIPNKKTIENTDEIDINPEISYDNVVKKGGPYFSIAIGSFSSLKKLKKLKKMLSEYGSIKVIKFRGQYMLLLGKFSRTQTALEKKIRLAEELGINGKLVRIHGNKMKTYIFGE